MGGRSTLSLGTANRSHRRLPWRRVAASCSAWRRPAIGLWLARRGAQSQEVGSKAAAEAREQPIPSVEVGPAPAGGHRADDPAAGDRSTHSSRSICTRWSPAISRRRMSISALGSRRARCWPRSTCRGTRRRSRRRRRWWNRRGPGRPGRGAHQGGPGPARGRGGRGQGGGIRSRAARSPAGSSPRNNIARVSGLVAGTGGHRPARRRADRATSRRRSPPSEPAISEILSAKAKLLAAEAAIDQAKADAAEVKASLGVAQARLDRAKVNLEYAKIVAPFDGVVTHRVVSPDVPSSARPPRAASVPLLTVKRTDLMRVVVLVPDRDVVLTKVGRSGRGQRRRPRRPIVHGDTGTDRPGRGRRADDARRDRPAQPGRPALRRDVRQGIITLGAGCQEPGRAGGLRRRAHRPIRRSRLRRSRRDRPAHRDQAGRRQRHRGRDPLRNQPGRPRSCFPPGRLWKTACASPLPHEMQSRSCRKREVHEKLR